MGRYGFDRTAVALSLVCGFAAAQTASSQSAGFRREWPGSGKMFPATLEDGIGFSFRFNGAEVGPATPAGWEIRPGPPGTLRLHHNSGLTLIRTASQQADSEAVEYWVHFKNEGTRASEVIENVRAMDLSFVHPDIADSFVLSSGGGLADAVFPPRTYAIRRRQFAPMTPVGGEVTLTTEGGRSSNGDLPFFFIQNQKVSEGLFVAVGWSGQWSATVAARPEKNQIHLTAAIPDLQIRLAPGEEIQGPHILVGAYHGSAAEGSNRLRNLIRDHYTPRLDGKLFEPPATYDHWWNIADRFDQPLLRQLADAAAALGQEYFLLDAGWYAGTGGTGGFSAGVGNWEEIDRQKFPDGLRPFADYVRSKGLHFGLWFEPERVARGSLLARQHPDWVIWLPDTTRAAPPFQSNNYGLLNYGRPEVREWVRRMMDRYITDLDIRYIRYDFNIDPLAYWTAHDSPDRRGITQLRHIAGFYQVIDWIRQKHPGTVLEGCASGGRRIDLETARRFHTFWISDHTIDPNIVRFHLEGLNYFLPGNYEYVCYSLPLPSEHKFSPADFTFQSFLGGAFGLGGRIHEWPAPVKAQALRHVQTFKKIRHYLMTDYYPLAPQPDDLSAWEGWQFHDPAGNSGFVQLFRTHAGTGSSTFRLHGLRSGKRYQFSDPYTGETVEHSGTEATARGITVRLDEMTSKVLIYRQRYE
jgi:alpha-galactosidase